MAESSRVNGNLWLKTNDWWLVHHLWSYVDFSFILIFSLLFIWGTCLFSQVMPCPTRWSWHQEKLKKITLQTWAKSYLFLVFCARFIERRVPKVGGSRYSTLATLVTFLRHAVRRQHVLLYRARDILTDCVRLIIFVFLDMLYFFIFYFSWMLTVGNVFEL